MVEKKEDLTLPDWGIVKAETLTTPHSILLYGPSGKGKTVMGASIVEVPGFERTLLIDTEGSSVAVGAWYPQVDVIHASDAKTFAKVVEALLSNKLVEPVSGLPYQVVIIDTFDKAQERQLEIFAKSPEAFVDGKENSFFKWGAIKTWTSKVADLLHYAPFLTIWVMHEDVDKNEQTGKTTTTVMLGGKSQQIFPSVPDIIGYFNIVVVEEDGQKVRKRAVDFRASEKLIAKQRFAGALDGIIADPTFEQVFKKIEPSRWKK
jgi:hypothetical protein